MPLFASNSILRELGVSVDPRNTLSRFLETSRTLALRTCRRNLRSVGVRKLFDIKNIGTHHKPSRKKSITKNFAKIKKTEQNNNHPSQEFESSTQVADVQKLLPNIFHNQPSSAQCSAQKCWPLVTYTVFHRKFTNLQYLGALVLPPGKHQGKSFN